MSAMNSRRTFISHTPSHTGLRSMGPFHLTGESSSRKKSMEPTFIPSGPTGGIAPSGEIVNRWPRMPSIWGTQGPFRSTSSTPTLWPCRARARARFTVVMLLPTPPLPLMTTSLWRTAAMRPVTAFICSVICWTTLASSAYFSRPRMSFRSFVAIARGALRICSKPSMGPEMVSIFPRRLRGESCRRTPSRARTPPGVETPLRADWAPVRLHPPLSQPCQQRFDLLLDLIPDFSKLLRRQSFRVGDVPVLALLGADVRTGVSATHRHGDGVFDSGDVGEGLGAMPAQIVAQLAHGLNGLGVDLPRRFGTCAIRLHGARAVHPCEGLRDLAAARVLHAHE